MSDAESAPAAAAAAAASLTTTTPAWSPLFVAVTAAAAEAMAELTMCRDEGNWSDTLSPNATDPCACGGREAGACGGSADAITTNATAAAAEAVWTMKYPLYATVILATLAGVCSIVTVVGNIMVLAAFALERSIRQPSNYLIASLAVTDVLIGLFSMPLYTLYLLSDQYWPLGEWPCDLWLSLDYTVCLVSQYTVFLITLDRFCSVKLPTRYRTWRNGFKMKVMIAGTWVVPSLVFFISILGWQHFVGERTVGPHECYVQFTEDPLFNTALVISYYWVTLVIMVGLYAGIYRVALGLQAKSAEKRKRVGRIASASSSGNASRREESESCGGDSCASPRPAAAAATGGNVVAVASAAAATTPPPPPRKDSVVVFDFRRTNGNRAVPGRNGTATLLLTPSPSDSPSPSPMPSPPSTHGKRSGVGMARWALTVTPLVRADSLSSCVSKDVAPEDEGTVEQSSPPPPPPQQQQQARPSALRLAFAAGFPGGVAAPMGCAASSPTAASQSIDSNPARKQLRVKSGGFVVDLESPLWKPRASLPTCKIDWACFDDAKRMAALQPLLLEQQQQSTTPPAPPCLAAAAVTAKTALAHAAPVESAVVQTNGHVPCRRVVSEPARPAAATAAPSATATAFASADAGAGDGQPALSKAIGKLCANIAQFARGSTKEPKAKRSNSENRAMKALKTITLILGAFVFFWTPYHIAVLVVGFCPQKQECVDKTFFALSYWLCYCNSPINPFCYALSNEQFKKSFLKMLRFQYCLRKRK